MKAIIGRLKNRQGRQATPVSGREKLQAVQALLRAGFVNGLIIDGDTALLLSEVRD